MDVAALSTALSQQKLQNDASLVMLNRTKNIMEQQGQQLVDMLEQSNRRSQHPDIGRQIDISI